MLVGQLAAAAGVNVQTIRFYERERILREPPRNSSGYRLYGQNDLEDIRFIKQSQELGFTLKEIQQLMKLHRAVTAEPSVVKRPREWADIAEITRARLDHLGQKLRLLRAMRMQLRSMLRRLETTGSRRCPASPNFSKKSQRRT